MRILWRKKIIRSFIDFKNFCEIRDQSSNEGGKSSAFFFATKDGRFIIKTLKKSEKIVFCKLLPEYLNRIEACPESKLVRILGLYKFKTNKTYFIVMENILPSRSQALIFDIKGYVADNRTTKKKGQGNVLKDKEFLEMDLELTSAEKDDLIETIRNDFEILRLNHIMDYSVIIGVYKNKPKASHTYLISTSKYFVYLGIIDIFQVYNFSKVVEGSLKKVFKGGVCVSSMDSNSYYDRFIQFLLLNI